MRAAASKLLFLLTVLVAVGSPVAAQFTSPIAQGARSGSLGGSLYYSPAERIVAVDYRRSYMLGTMADKSIRMQMPVWQGSAFAAYSHRGDVSWHEQQLALGYGMDVTPWLHAAVGARWLSRGTDDAHYEVQQWVSPSVLMQVSLPATLLTLVAGTRPWDDQSPWQMHLQVAYRAMSRWLTVAEIEREEHTRLRLGMEYVIGERWFLRAGMATRPMVPTFGLGIRQKCLSVDFAVEVHNALGLTPQTSLSLWF